MELDLAKLPSYVFLSANALFLGLVANWIHDYVKQHGGYRTALRRNRETVSPIAPSVVIAFPAMLVGAAAIAIAQNLGGPPATAFELVFAIGVASPELYAVYRERARGIRELDGSTVAALTFAAGSGLTFLVLAVVSFFANGAVVRIS